MRMFLIGDKIVYGSDGVFSVEEYTSSPFDKNDTRQFYLLRPVHGPVGNIIITPADNERVKMRSVMSKDEAMAFIDTIPSISILTVDREKNRRDTYRKALDGATPEVLVSIIKTVRTRREEYAKVKKRVSETDNDYEKKAKNCLYGELSVSLGIRLEEVDGFIDNRLACINL